MQLTTIDFETYYDSKDFSLSKMTTEAYIRDPRFHVIGVSIKIGDALAQWYAEGWNLDDTNDVVNALSMIDWGNTIMLSHNTMFDGAILAWIYGHRPKHYMDTLSMAAALGLHSSVGGSLKALMQHMQDKGMEVPSKGTAVHDFNGYRRKDFSPTQLAAYGDYCNNDVECTRLLFDYLAEGFNNHELQVISHTIRLFTQPVLVLDRTVLLQYQQKIHADKEALLDKCGVTIDALRSDDKFAALLEEFFVTPPTKVSPRTGKVAYAFSKTDEGLLALLEHDNSDVVALVEARIGNKSSIAESRVQRFIDIEARGALPFPLKYFAAHTGRFGGTDKINLQNLTRGSPMRTAICAPAGHSIISCDSSQIEARVLVWLAGQLDVVQQFAGGEDVYSIFASKVFGRTITKEDKEQRFVGKVSVLGLGFQMGAAKFQGTLKRGGVNMPITAAKGVVDVYRSANPMVGMLWAQAQDALEIMCSGFQTYIGKADDEGFGVECYPAYGDQPARIKLPNGMFIRYPNLRRVHTDRGTGYVYDTKKGRAVVETNIYGGKVIENLVQALARIVITDQWCLIYKELKKVGDGTAMVVGQVHDELIVCTPDSMVAEVREVMEAVMSMAPSWAEGLPVACESGVGKNYGEC